MPKTYNILSVEDDDDQFELIKIALKGMPLAIRRAGNGDEALAEVAQSKPDLLLLDLTLPDMRGWDVLNWLSANGNVLENVPVLVLTAHTESSHRVIARLREVAQYINKPFVPSVLRKTIKQILKIV